MTASTLAPGRVAIVGPGKLGTVLAAGLARAGHQVVAVVGGGPAAGTRFSARFPDAVATADPGILAGVDLVVVATPDDAVERAVTDLAVTDGIREGQRVVHVAGSLGLAPLRRAALAGARVAACHPAQTVPAADVDPEILRGTAWAVTAAAAELPWAAAFVQQLGGVPHEVADSQRVLYHAALVIASNAVAATVSVARQLLLAVAIGEPSAFLAPLVRSSTDNVLAAGAAAITGPVARGDLGTLRRHLDALDHDAPALATAYRHLGIVVLDQVRPALDAAVARDIDRLLGDA